MNNVFVLYDRGTGSVWYPLKDGGFDAVAGAAQGSHIPFLRKPDPVPLADWVKIHPKTKVLLPPPLPERMRRRMEARKQAMNIILGKWEMKTMVNDAPIDAVMTLALEKGQFVGSWASKGRTMELKNLRFDGTTLKFDRETSPEQVLSFEGKLRRKRLIGKYTGPAGELQCNGARPASN